MCWKMIFMLFTLMLFDVIYKYATAFVVFLTVTSRGHDGHFPSEAVGYIADN